MLECHVRQRSILTSILCMIYSPGNLILLIALSLLVLASDEEYMDMCNVSEERRKIIRKKTAPQSRIHPLAAEHALYWDRKFQGSNALVQRYLKKMGLPHHDPPLPLPRIPEHEGVDAEERRPFRIYGNLINHIPPPLRDRRIKDGSSGYYDTEYKLFECNKDHVWPAIEKKEPNRFGITAEYRKNVAKVNRMLRSKARTIENGSSEHVDAESGDEKSLGDVFLEKEANGESSNNDSLDSEDVKEEICERQHLYLSRQSAKTVEVILRPNRNPKSSSRLISPRELPSFYLFVDEAATIAHLQQFILMRTNLSCSRTKVSILMSKIIWECKAARMAMLQCIRDVGLLHIYLLFLFFNYIIRLSAMFLFQPESNSSCISSFKGINATAEIRDIANSTAYTISTKDGDSTVYATMYPVQKLDESLHLTDVSFSHSLSLYRPALLILNCSLL
uniref:GLUCAGON domain-containing protein n=1 Tax=Angiostrongylus cantonensis TaxID=6313 RepID=A0A0K0DE41_ANGCA